MFIKSVGSVSSWPIVCASVFASSFLRATAPWKRNRVARFSDTMKLRAVICWLTCCVGLASAHAQPPRRHAAGELLSRSTAAPPATSHTAYYFDQAVRYLRELAVRITDNGRSITFLTARAMRLTPKEPLNSAISSRAHTTSPVDRFFST